MKEPGEFTDLPFDLQIRIRETSQATNNLAFGYAGVLMIARPPSEGGPLNHGSGLILRHGTTVSFLTADHTVEQWVQRREQEPTVALHLASPRGSAQITDATRVRWRSRELDLAVVRLTPAEAASTGLFQYDILDWPPPPPQVGEMVWIAGLPAKGHIEITTTAHEFLAFTLGTHITTVAEPNFKCLFERAAWISNGAAESAPTELGGISGGPVMAMRGLRLTLLGVVQEHSTSVDILIVSRLDAIPESALHDI